jgi:hypothetical protein
MLVFRRFEQEYVWRGQRRVARYCCEVCGTAKDPLRARRLAFKPVFVVEWVIRCLEHVEATDWAEGRDKPFPSPDPNPQGDKVLAILERKYKRDGEWVGPRDGLNTEERFRQFQPRKAGVRSPSNRGPMPSTERGERGDGTHRTPTRQSDAESGGHAP